MRADAAGVGRVHDGARLHPACAESCDDGHHAQLIRTLILLMLSVNDFKPCKASLIFCQVRTVDQGRGGPYEIAPGSTPLHAAASRGDVGIVQAVIQVQRPQYRSVSGLFCSKSPDFIWYYGIMATLSP